MYCHGAPGYAPHRRHRRHGLAGALAEPGVARNADTAPFPFLFGTSPWASLSVQCPIPKNNPSGKEAEKLKFKQSYHAIQSNHYSRCSDLLLLHLVGEAGFEPA